MGYRIGRIALFWVLVLLTAWVAEPYIMDAIFSANGPRSITPRADLTEAERTTIDIFKRTSPSVVHVFARPAAQAVGDYGSEGQVVQSGSGVLWDAAGHVVTNNHVISGTNAIGVRLVSGEFVNANIVGVAPSYDVAVLQLERPRSPLQSITVGKSADLEVGQWTFAIGNPYGLDQTLTSGIISALHRRLPEATHFEIDDVIQTDAAINPGNSGGPLLDSAGRLIGLNTAILSGSGASAGIGFALPVDTVNRVVSQLITQGRVPVPGIGVVSAGEQATSRLGIDGVVVVRTLPDSPAAKAGLRGVDPTTGVIGDIITAVDGHPVRTLADLTAALQQAGIGNPVELTVEHEGQSREVRVTVADVAREMRNG